MKKTYINPHQYLRDLKAEVRAHLSKAELKELLVGRDPRLRRTWVDLAHHCNKDLKNPASSDPSVWGRDH